jgi:hypothetical protein
MVQIANERSFGGAASAEGRRGSGGRLAARVGRVSDVGPDGIVLYTLNTDARTPT